ncbi:hypothetical protein [Aeromicrobium sp. CF3.5]|uniref:hypothetical protein n=1 Tax=Aeromicrobium sp. CF3.5 TaxID=3373078 RepID=UPI003EE46283
MFPRRGLVIVSSMTLLLSGAAGVASASEPENDSAPANDSTWQVQVYDDVQVSVRVQCSADDTAAVAVHLVDPLSRGAKYTAVIDAGGPAMSAGPTNNLIEADPVYFFMDSDRSAGSRGTVSVAMTKSLGTDATKNATLQFDRPGIDCAPAPA